jgi:dTDP-glucose 4,6-dehydratase
MRLDDGRAVPAFVDAALRGLPLPVFGDGSQTRSLCYVDDLIEGIVRLLISDYVGPVNVGNAEEVTILHLAEVIQEIVGSNPGIEFQPLPQDDPTVRCPDTSLAERELGWKAAVPLREGMERTVAWFRQRDA